MSYPLILQPLVVEDEEGAKDAYENIFETIAADFTELPFSPAKPCFAFSHEEAVAHLESSKIFHVVILDLRLPQKPKLPPVDDIELGMNLLTRCLDRDRFPIPALLVISGHIGSTEQTRMQETLREGFHYGRLFAKGDYGLLEQEIRRASKEALRYCSVGIHIRSAGDAQYPVVTPREEDLLRRSVMQQQGVIGLDLNWWSAKKLQPGIDPGANPWTKVLMGRYLLDSGHGASRPKFFKLLPGSDARPVIESARHIEHKLNHIKITSTILSRSTGLIVTEKVGAKDARPKSLQEFIRHASTEQTYQVGRQIVTQVQQLGDLLPDSKPLNKILWAAHDVALLREQWERFKGADIQKQLGLAVDPVALYAELAAREVKIRVRERSLVHGDLHLSNVALDVGSDGSGEAYIFDPGVVTRNVAGRDLAVLEVSAILHQEISFETISEVCSAVYRSSDTVTTNSASAIADPVGGKVVEFIRAIREAAASWNDWDVYSLMVFDFALVQLGGLAYGSSGNKISDPLSAVYLLAVVADWHKRLAGE